MTSPLGLQRRPMLLYITTSSTDIECCTFLSITRLLYVCLLMKHIQDESMLSDQLIVTDKQPQGSYLRILLLASLAENRRDWAKLDRQMLVRDAHLSHTDDIWLVTQLPRETDRQNKTGGGRQDRQRERVLEERSRGRCREMQNQVDRQSDRLVIHADRHGGSEGMCE